MTRHRSSSVKQLIVRRIEDEVVRALRLRAAEHGWSMEAEHRQILRETLLGGNDAPSFKEHLESMPEVGTDDDFMAPRDLPRGVD